MPKSKSTGEAPSEPAAEESRYVRIISEVFRTHYTKGSEEVRFEREDLNRAADALQVPRVKNLGDIVSSFKFRQELPAAIQNEARTGFEWRLETAGRSTYRFRQVRPFSVKPNPNLAETKIPDATPGIVARYALGDEQAVLAKLRYNRLVDIFTGVACYSLQNHLRTSVEGIGQIETDEIYVGVDKRGVQFIFPIQAKRRNDTLGPQQIEQDLALCREKFPTLVCRPIAAQFIEDDRIAMFELQESSEGLRIVSERHYRLVARDDVSPEDLRRYQNSPE